MGNGFDIPFPDATDVVVQRADIPSAQFPGVWQEGRADGFGYRLFANGDGDVRANDPTLWSIGFQCLSTEDGCSSTISGTPPEAAILLANRLQSCLLGEDPVEPEIEEPELVEAEDSEVEAPALTETESQDVAETEAESPDLAEAEDPVTTEVQDPVSTDVEDPVVVEAEDPAPAPVETPEPEPCGVALLPDVSDPIALQRLLVMAGANPGPIDGIIGRRTRNALRQVTNLNLSKVGVPDAIVALDALLCHAQD